MAAIPVLILAESESWRSVHKTTPHLEVRSLFKWLLQMLVAQRCDADIAVQIDCHEVRAEGAVRQCVSQHRAGIVRQNIVL